MKTDAEVLLMQRERARERTQEQAACRAGMSVVPQLADARSGRLAADSLVRSTHARRTREKLKTRKSAKEDPTRAKQAHDRIPPPAEFLPCKNKGLKGRYPGL